MTELEAMVRIKKMVQKPNPKLRVCISCGTMFTSHTNGHRMCSVCKNNKSHYGIRAAKTCGLMLDRLKSFKDNE